MSVLLALCSGAAVFFLIVAWGKRHGTQEADVVKQRMRSLHEPDEQRLRSSLDEQMRLSFFQRIIAPLNNGVRRMMLKFTPHTLYEIAAKKTSAAGGGAYKWGVDGFIAYWTTVSGLTTVLMLFYLVGSVDPMGKRFVIFCLGLVAGFYLPIAMIDWRISRRRARILLQLPDMLDLLCVSVQAGLSFDAALRRITERMRGPLIDECVLLLQEVRFGMTRRQAMERLAERCSLQEVSLWVAAIAQADKLGVSMADILVVQAENMREGRRQRARKLAQQAPIKMLLPLVVFIFPAMFVVTLLPVLMAMLAGFGAVAGK